MTHQCEGVTVDGYECQRDASHGSRFCWQHGGRKSRRAPARRVRRTRRVYTPRRARTLEYLRASSTPRPRSLKSYALNKLGLGRKYYTVA